MGLNKDAIPKFVMPLKNAVGKNTRIKDSERFRSLTTDITTPNDILPMPNKLLAVFFGIHKQTREFL